MLNIEVAPPSGMSPDAVPALIERRCAEEGLSRTLLGTLAAYPGCIHWHFKKGKERGTLEITWWPQRNRLWFKVATNRAGPWIAGTMARLKAQLEMEG